MILLPQDEYVKTFLSFGGKRHWYGYPRGFQFNRKIYINQEAFYLDDRDSQLLIAHEKGHTEGKEHTWFGVMSPWGLVRYLTSPWGLMRYL